MEWRWAGHMEWIAGGASGRLAGLLVTCDQVVVCRDRVLEKPISPAEVRPHAARVRDAYHSLA